MRQRVLEGAAEHLPPIHCDAPLPRLHSVHEGQLLHHVLLHNPHNSIKAHIHIAQQNDLSPLLVVAPNRLDSSRHQLPSHVPIVLQSHRRASDLHSAPRAPDHHVEVAVQLALFPLLDVRHAVEVLSRTRGQELQREIAIRGHVQRSVLFHHDAPSVEQTILEVAAVLHHALLALSLVVQTTEPVGSVTGERPFVLHTLQRALVLPHVEQHALPIHCVAGTHLTLVQQHAVHQQPTLLGHAVAETAHERVESVQVEGAVLVVLPLLVEDALKQRVVLVVLLVHGSQHVVVLAQHIAREHVNRLGVLVVATVQLDVAELVQRLRAQLGVRVHLHVLCEDLEVLGFGLLAHLRIARLVVLERTSVEHAIRGIQVPHSLLLPVLPLALIVENAIATLVLLVLPSSPMGTSVTEFALIETEVVLVEQL